MPKQGSIKQYRQTGEGKAPSELPFGELAVAKDGTLYVGNAADAPVQAGTQLYVHAYDAEAKRHNFTGGGELGRALVTAAVNTGDTFAVNGTVIPAYTGEDETDELPMGRWVTFVFDGTQLNFNAGGSGMDFKVIAAATAQELPSAAREKTLAVLTSTALNGYAFSPTTPAAAAGRVWVKTQPVPASGGNAFNAAKKEDRALEIVLAGVFQYIGSAWETRAAQLYLGGAWQDVTYSVTYAQGRAGTFVPQVKADLAHGAATPAFTGTVTKLPGFTFTGWSPAVASTVTEAASYTALFNQDQYFVRYLPGAQGTFAMQTYANLLYGAPRPAFQGAVTGNGLYDFAGWSPALASTVTGSVDYTAQWVHTPYYYNRSNEFAAKTGGWSACPFRLSGGYKTVNGFEKTADRMWVQLDYNGGSYNTMMTNSPVNMTGVSFINFEMYASAQYPENSNVYLCVCPSREIVIGGGDTALAAWSFHGGYGEYSHSGVLSLDVRSLSGNYYIGGLAFSQGYYVQLSLYSIYGS